MRLPLTAPLLVVALTTAAPAHEGATGVVKERMDAMEEMGEATKLLALLAQGAIPHDAARVTTAADILETRMVLSLDKFPEGSDQHPTRALPAVWSDRADFDAKAQDLITLAQDLRRAAADPQVTLALIPQINDSCRACHRPFRARR